MNKNGFALLMLVIVIAIIAVLMAIQYKSLAPGSETDGVTSSGSAIEALKKAKQVDVQASQNAGVLQRALDQIK